jgi:hypothetical protein
MAAVRVRHLLPDELVGALAFLNPQELLGTEKVCRAWKQATQQEWKRRYRTLLDVASSVDLKSYFPADCFSCKGALLKVFSKVFGPEIYPSYLRAKVASPPKAALTAFFRKFNQPDSCDPMWTIGQSYYLVYSPPDFTIHIAPNTPFYSDNGTLKKVEGLTWIAQQLGFRRKGTVTIPNTMNNLFQLFAHPVKGHANPSDSMDEIVMDQHGDERIASGWICMRELPFEANDSFAEQQAAALKAGVTIADLGTRTLFNLLMHMHTRVYPDGRGFRSHVRTATTLALVGRNWTIVCGEDDRRRGFTASRELPPDDHWEPGAAIVLPLEK